MLWALVATVVCRLIASLGHADRGIRADAVVLVHLIRCATHEPGSLFLTGSDVRARADRGRGVGVNDWMASQGLAEPLTCHPRPSEDSCWFHSCCGNGKKRTGATINGRS
jgi:hypothetical protein